MFRFPSPRTVLFCATLALLGWSLYTRDAPRPSLAVPPAAAVETSARPGGGDLSTIAETAVKSVVNISSIKIVRYQPYSPFLSDPFFQQFFGRSPQARGPAREYREKSLGSGVIVDPAGLILTNHHVIANADEISIKWMDQIEIPAKVVGSDPHTDLALLRIPAPRGIGALPMGDSDRLRLAETVLAIGSPFGLGGTVTQGIVSAKGRANVGIVDYEDFIQTDAAINPGNSGGALVNQRGELVGINTAIFSKSGGYQGIGFAIPINMAKPIMEQLLRNGKVERGWLGLRYQDLTADIARALQQSSDDGVIVAYVYPQSPGDRGGIGRGDVLTRFNGTEIRGAGHLSKLIAETPVGGAVRLTVRRGRETLELSMNVERVPQNLRRED